MSIIVAEGTCKSCSHSENPIRHTDCFGAFVKQTGTWKCYSCGVSNGTEIFFTCDNCGKSNQKARQSIWQGDNAELDS